MATPPVEDPHLADLDSDTSLPPPPPHNLHSSYSMPSFSGNPIHRPYLSLNPIAASARTSLPHQDGEGDESSRPHDNQENSASPTADVHENEKEHDHDNKEKKKEEDSTASAPPVESQSQRVETPAPPAPTVPQVHLTFLLISSRRRSMAFEPRQLLGG
ncbi:hypothetical protein BDQ17DRAFT_1429867 [Cyathus striatus]|nr:hypothetical protein BDQ17DRAFT_1429867 [Cyathus striatus]